MWSSAKTEKAVYAAYKLMHILGLLFTFTGLAGVVFAFAITATPQPKMRKLAFITHGLGLLLILVSGFGMLARMGLVNGLPPWIHAKLTLWVLAGAVVALAKRKSAKLAVSVYAITIVIGFTAAYIAIYKPF